jgi:uncharacterized Zn ribbon protein
MTDDACFTATFTIEDPFPKVGDKMTVELACGIRLLLIVKDIKIKGNDIVLRLGDSE